MAGIPQHFTQGPGASPAFDGDPIVPSDTVDLGDAARAIYIGADGNVCLDTLASGTTLTFVGLKAGSILPVAARRVRATLTTATGLIALF
jgi:hypothetical protein